MHTLFFFVFCSLLCGCSSQEAPDSERTRKSNQTGEYIYRTHNEYLFVPNPPKKVPRKLYPWETAEQTKYPKITKEFFRCKGSSLNPARTVQKQGKETVRYHDCGGATKHSLPIRAEKEFIYPILVDLLNYIQKRTGHQVVITSGHRCPAHNAYVDVLSEDRYSKHMIGAEVDFYLRGLENAPEKIVRLIFQYYQQNPKYKELKEYQAFQRFKKGKTNVSTPPWYNKEVFVKLFSKKEGRTYDNRHPYPYVSIQVRYDEETKERVAYSWQKAQNNFQRW